MSSLPFDFSQVLTAFDCPNVKVQAYEKKGELVGGRWVETKENLRTLAGCILLGIDPETLALIAEGNQVDEAYCLMYDTSADKFYIQDQQDAAIQPLQTYVLIEGKEFLITKNPKTRQNTNFDSYFAIRYKAIKDDNTTNTGY